MHVLIVKNVLLSLMVFEITSDLILVSLNFNLGSKNEKYFVISIILEEKPFTCEICHEGFKYRKAYRDHRKRYHQDPLEQPQCSIPSYNWSVI